MSNSDSDVGCAACVCPFSFCALFLPQQLTCVCVCVWADIGGVAVLAMCINNSKSFMQISVKQDRGGERKGSLTVIAARCKSSSQEQYLCVCVCVLFFVFAFVPHFDYCAFWRLSSSAALHEATQLAQKARMTQKRLLKPTDD